MRSLRKLILSVFTQVNDLTQIKRNQAGETEDILSVSQKIRQRNIQPLIRSSSISKSRTNIHREYRPTEAIAPL